MHGECWAYITIQTLLLWKALSFLLCAGKHHWERQQNTSKRDTNSCRCGWLHGWMELSICLWFRSNKRRLNYTAYGTRHAVQSHSALCHQAASRTTRLFFKYFIVNIPPLSSSVSVSVYRHTVGAFRVSPVYAVASTPVCLLPFGTKKQITNVNRNPRISSTISVLVGLAQRRENVNTANALLRDCSWKLCPDSALYVICTDLGWPPSSHPTGV